MVTLFNEHSKNNSLFPGQENRTFHKIKDESFILISD